MDPRQPRARAVAIVGERIRAVGGDEVVAAWRDQADDLVDARGLTLLPGLIDAHVHLFGLAESLIAVDCGPGAVTGIADLQARLRARAATLPPGAWLRAVNLDETALAEGRFPTRRELDAAVPAHAVRLRHRARHALVLNSLGLALAGYTRDTPDPPGGVLERDPATGELTGVLREIDVATGAAARGLDDPELREGLALACRSFLAQGVTSVHEATASNGLAEWQAYQRLRAEGALPLRLHMLSGAQALPEIVAAGLSPGAGDAGLSLGGVKLLLDETTGAVYPPLAEVTATAVQARRAGFPVALHTLTEQTLLVALSAIQAARQQIPEIVPRLPDRLEHAGYCPPELLPLLAETPVTVVTQPSFLYYRGARYRVENPPAYLPALYRLRSLRPLAALALGSDCPVVPNDSRAVLLGAATRRPLERDGSLGSALAPDETISVAEALRLYTVGGARASGEAGRKGVIVPGALADLALWSGEPITAPPERLLDLRVIQTWVGGRLVWQDSASRSNRGGRSGC